MGLAGAPGPAGPTGGAGRPGNRGESVRMNSNSDTTTQIIFYDCAATFAGFNHLLDSLVLLFLSFLVSRAPEVPQDPSDRPELEVLL